jgi:hypothetical protein
MWERRLRTTLVLVACSLQVLVTSCRNQTEPKFEMSREQCAAVKRAEEYIARHGYTDAPATADPSEAPELFDRLLPREAVLAQRRGTVKAHAYGLFAGTLDAPQDGWTVVFEYQPRSAPEPDKSIETEGHVPVGVAVLVSPRGLRMEHMDVKLASVQVRFPDSAAVAQACARFTPNGPER